MRFLAKKIKNRILGPINRFWPPNKRITCAHISLHSAKSQGKVKAEMKKICLLTILGLFVIAEAKPQNNQGNNIQWNEERQEVQTHKQVTITLMSPGTCTLNSRGERMCTPRQETQNVPLPMPRECTQQILFPDDNLIYGVFAQNLY